CLDLTFRHGGPTDKLIIPRVVNLAIVYDLRGRPADAKAALEKGRQAFLMYQNATVGNGLFAKYYHALGKACLQLGDVAAAERHLNEVRNRGGVPHDPAYFAALGTLAGVYWEQGKSLRAIELTVQRVQEQTQRGQTGGPEFVAGCLNLAFWAT